jgi:hypothetical protein
VSIFTEEIHEEITGRLRRSSEIEFVFGATAVEIFLATKEHKRIRRK